MMTTGGTGFTDETLMLISFLLILGWGLGGILTSALKARSLTKKQNTVLAQLPALLRRSAGALTSGSHPVSVQRDILQCFQQAASSDVSRDFKQLAKRSNLAVFSQLASLAELRRLEGIDLARAWEHLADRLELELKAQSLAQVATAPVRAQARLVLFVLPVLVLMVFMFEPEATQLLFTTQAGVLILLLCAGISLGMQWGFARVADLGGRS